MSDQKRSRSLSPLTLVLLLSGVFFAIFLVVSGALYLYKSPVRSSGKGTSSGFFGGGSVGVIEVNGVIMDSKKILARLERYEEDDDIRAVVVRLNSPGGAVGPSQEIYEAIRKFRKPVVASMASIAASGAFYIACGAQKVFANPGTITGSIGVIMEFANLEKLYEWAKIKRYVIKTGKFKDAGAEYREMSPEERGLLQTMVDDVLLQFKQAVSTGRKLNMEQVTAIADGRVMSGSQAKQAKLVDELGTLQDAINEAGKLAKIKGKPSVVYPDRHRRKWLELLLDENSRDESAESESPIASGMGGGALATRFVEYWMTRALQFNRLDTQASQVPSGIYWIWRGAWD